jgi:hypothetical protein
MWKQVMMSAAGRTHISHTCCSACTCHHSTTTTTTTIILRHTTGSTHLHLTARSSSPRAVYITSSTQPHSSSSSSKCRRSRRPRVTCSCAWAAGLTTSGRCWLKRGCCVRQLWWSRRGGCSCSQQGLAGSHGLVGQQE